MKTNKIIGAIIVAGMLSGCSVMGDKHNVFFDSGSIQIKAAGKAKLAKIARLAKKEDMKIKLSGYTDSTGSKEMNKKISEKRVNVVRNQLLRHGVKPMKISHSIKGEGWFDKDGKANAKKRRVELSVY